MYIYKMSSDSKRLKQRLKQFIICGMLITNSCSKEKNESKSIDIEKYNERSDIEENKYVNEYDVSEVVDMEFKLWLLQNLTASPDERKDILNKIRIDTIRNFNIQKKILDQYHKEGGQIKNIYIEQNINRMVRDLFKGDWQEFRKALHETGLKIDSLREIQRRKIILNAMGYVSSTNRNIREGAP